jgi:hypothetical protein
MRSFVFLFRAVGRTEATEMDNFRLNRTGSKEFTRKVVGWGACLPEHGTAVKGN